MKNADERQDRDFILAFSHSAFCIARIPHSFVTILRMVTTTLRVGIGHDTHRLAEGRPLLLGGVRVEHAAAWSATATPTWCCTP